MCRLEFQIKLNIVERGIHNQSLILQLLFKLQGFLIPLKEDPDGEVKASVTVPEGMILSVIVTQVTACESVHQTSDSLDPF